MGIGNNKHAAAARQCACGGGAVEASVVAGAVAIAGLAVAASQQLSVTCERSGCLQSQQADSCQWLSGWG